MKISMNWVRDYVSLPDDIDYDKLAYDLTMSTVEVESVERPFAGLSAFMLARVTDVQPHPNADRLVVATCDIGGSSATVVCGGANLKVGMDVAYAPPGSFVNWHGESELTELKLAKVRGVESAGMICAPEEIFLGDFFDVGDREILDLSSFNGAPGTSLSDLLGIDDVIIEVDNKSITNRPDLWGHYGIARELSAIYDLELKPLPPLPELPQAPRVISEVDEVLRFSETRITGVQLQESPFWLASRLACVGQRPINLHVDLTNYVMLALGQPTHAFDASRIAGGLHVRFAAPGETLKLLDETDAAIAETDLVVCDDDGPVALAGIMGGGERSINDTTGDIIFECATFNGRTIRSTSSRLNIRTESSARFEKFLDPEMVTNGVALFLSLLSEIQPNATVTAFADHYPAPTLADAIPVTLEFLDWRLGEKIAPDVMVGYLNKLGFTVEATEDRLTVTPPSWRATGDISLPEDIVEEVARLHGYEHFAFQPPRIDLTTAINQADMRLERGIREFLATTGGMREVFSYPWVEDQFLEASGISLEDCVQIGAPPSPTMSRLQPSLVPQLLRLTSENLRFTREFRLFELGRVFRNGQDPDDPSLPFQPKQVAGVLAGANAQQLFRSARGILDELARSIGIESFAYGTTQSAAWADQNLQLAIELEGQPLGVVGCVSRKTRLRSDIKHSFVVVFELDVSVLKNARRHAASFIRIPEFPQVENDISIVVDASTAWSDLEAVARECDELVRDVCFVDEYAGKGIDDGQKSVTLRVVLGSDEGTLKSEQVEAVVSGLVQKYVEQFNAVQRA